MRADPNRRGAGTHKDRPQGIPRVRASFSAALLLALAAGTGCDSESLAGPPVPDFGDADEDLTSTLADLLAGVRAAPTSGELRGRLAMAYDINGFIDAAVVTYEQAERLDPEEFSWPYFRSLRLGDRADYENALAVLDHAISIDDGYVPTWLWRGTWLLELERYEEATAAYQRAENLGAGSPAIVGRAQTLLRQGRHEDAIALLEPLNERLPHPHIHLLLGQAYRALGRIDDARIAMARGRQAESMRWMDPRWNKRNAYIAGFGERLVHAQNLINAGMAREALRAIEPLKAMREDDPYLISTLAWAHTSLNLLDQAAEIVEDGLRKHPDYPRFHFHLATIAEKRGDREDERHHLERALELDPNNAAVYERLGLLATREQRLDDAIAHLDDAFRLGAQNPVKVLHTIGLIQGTRERWPEAIEQFQRAVAIDESFTIGFIYLGRCLAEAGRFEEAEEALSWAERLGTHPVELASAHLRIADLRSDEGQ